MKSNTLIQLIALPATLASLLGVDIVAPTVHSGVEVKVRKESADQQPSTMTADQDSNQRYPSEWCLTDNRWTRFCKDKDVVQVLGHINLTMPTIEPRLITMVVRDVQTPTKWTASCNITVTGNMTLIKEEGIENVVWDMTKLEGGLLDYDLKEGFKTRVIEFKCGEGWANPERKAKPWNKEGSFAESFPQGE